MLNKKNMWKLKTYLDRAWTLSKDLSLASVNLRGHGRGIAIVAHEMRRLTESLFATYEDLVNQDQVHLEDEDLHLMLRNFSLLGLNGMIENLRLKKILQDKTDGYTTAILIEDIKNLFDDILDLIYNQSPPTLVELEVKDPSLASQDTITLMAFQAGGRRYVENLDYILEVVSHHGPIEKNLLPLRGLEIPMLDLGANTDQAFKTILVIQPAYSGDKTLYGVLVDDIHQNNIFSSRIGRPSGQRDTTLFIREAWDSMDPDQFLFVDWLGLAKA